jgi:D-glycero-D-manno-heptose 1,7-bisphosphate phosphatase
MNEEAPSKRFALLDRDGTIIVDKVYLRDPGEIEFAPGAIEGLRLLRDAGFSLVLITNQSGIARGLLDAATLEQIHARLQCLLEANGLRLEAIYYCPHGSDDHCDCRKPAPGMVRSAMRDFDFGPEEAVFIGDGDADMEAAAAAGIRAVRIAPAGSSGVEGAAADLLEAARRACAPFSERDGGDFACT